MIKFNAEIVHVPYPDRRDRDRLSKIVLVQTPIPYACSDLDRNTSLHGDNRAHAIAIVPDNNRDGDRGDRVHGGDIRAHANTIAYVADAIVPVIASDRAIVDRNFCSRSRRACLVNW